ncbi:hypothetical protein SAMN05216178_6637 [Pseudomonas saponiphila]|jgi:hypothetical protein|uniref:Uncharacterized protein n=1 Tax=Pseudomonas saponiphila TaxID=556534 RepID=A0A1H4ZHW1_9PSED|nr:hypothetical protein [Pseudomonas saponiphila]SED29021.1 hypothetical protein SAMN05216178_6637 [Pseudomonas saponiphila]
MTQRFIKLDHPAIGRKVSVMVGYDRPLSYFFMIIEDEESPDDDLVYSNLEDPKAGFPKTLDRYREVLAGMGMTIPETVWAAVLEDQKNNAGNLVAWYDSTGTEISSDDY